MLDVGAEGRFHISPIRVTGYLLELIDGNDARTVGVSKVLEYLLKGQ